MDHIYEKITDDTEFGVEFDEKSDIQNFFTGQTIFLTGGTGFLGKCFIEKLLRVCSDVHKVYILVRPRKTSADERMKRYFQNVLFDKLRKLRPNFESKVATIEGDIMMENLGLSEADRNTIINEVTMIIHTASNVIFAAPISKLLRANVLGTQYMLNLAKAVKNLNIFVYMSTAFSHCYQQHIEDTCYPAPADLKMVLDFIDVDEKTPGGINETGRQEIQAPWPNMYTYSKAIAESLIEDFAKHAPFRCVIYRPSIVLPTYREPIRGWSGNGYGPSMMVVGWALGFLHVGHKGNYASDAVPADMSTNALIAIMWDAIVNRKEKKTVIVYNYGSSTINQLTLMAAQNYGSPRIREMPSPKAILPCFKIETDYTWLFWIFNYLLHFLPVVLVDAALLIMGRKPIALKVYFKIISNAPWILYFTNGNWRIHVRAMRDLWDRMSEADKHLFCSDLRTLSWDDYMYFYWPGLRAYLIKEPISSPEEQAKIQRRIALVEIAAYALAALFTSFVLFYFRNFFLLFLLPFYNLHKLCCLMYNIL